MKSVSQRVNKKFKTVQDIVYGQVFVVVVVVVVVVAFCLEKLYLKKTIVDY